MTTSNYIILGVVTLALVGAVVLAREQLSRWRTRRLFRRRGIL